jgi:hypothetical protein
MIPKHPQCSNLRKFLPLIWAFIFLSVKREKPENKNDPSQA